MMVLIVRLVAQLLVGMVVLGIILIAGLLYALLQIAAFLIAGGVALYQGYRARGENPA